MSIIKTIINEIEKEKLNITKINTPNEVINYFEELYLNSKNISRENWGIDSSGREIYSYSIGSGSKCILFYAFPDPGEAVGGTGIMMLLNILINNYSFVSNSEIKWIFVPCINFVDQPNNGISLEKVQKLRIQQEIDWCLDAPREETKVLMDIASKYKPFFVFPLHDEFHCEDYVAPYFGFHNKIKVETSINIKRLFGNYEMDMNEEYSCEGLGKGFFEMKSIGDEYKNSTFYYFSQYGQVVFSEMPNKINLPVGDLVYLQLATGLNVLDELLTN